MEQEMGSTFRHGRDMRQFVDFATQRKIGSLMRRATSAKRMKANVRDKKTDELFGVARSSAFFHGDYIL